MSTVSWTHCESSPCSINTPSQLPRGRAHRLCAPRLLRVQWATLFDNHESWGERGAGGGRSWVRCGDCDCFVPEYPS
eukprot:gene7598-biopygen13596